VCDLGNTYNEQRNVLYAIFLQTDDGTPLRKALHPVSDPRAETTAPFAATELHLTTRGPDETVALGERIGQAIRSNLFIALSGDLGAGKTTFTRGLAAGLGIPHPVTSPTFTLVNDYAIGRGSQARRLVHVDVYRLDGVTGAEQVSGAEQISGAELDGIGFGDLLDDLEAPADFGLFVLAMEWADRLGTLLPEERLEVWSLSDEEEPDLRRFTLTGQGESALELLNRLTGE